jgi:hypothetical protein
MNYVSLPVLPKPKGSHFIFFNTFYTKKHFLRGTITRKGFEYPPLATMLKWHGELDDFATVKHKNEIFVTVTWQFSKARISHSC